MMGIEINTISNLLIAFASLLNLPLNISQASLIKQMPQVSKWQYSRQQGDITLNVQAFTKNEAKSFFKEDLVTKGYRPIIIQIINTNNNDEYVYSKHYIDLPIVDEKIIISHLSIKMFPIIALLLLKWAHDAKLSYFWSGIGLGELLINHLISKTIQNISPASITIPPRSAASAIIFVDEAQFIPNFEMKVFDPKNNTFFDFAIDLFQKQIHPPLFMIQ